MFKRVNFHIRGWTALGLFNTVTGILFNRVLVRMYDRNTHKTIKYYWDSVEKHN